MSAEIPSGPGMVERRLRVADPDVVWLRSLIEGYEGLALLYGDGSGIVRLIAPESRAAELDSLLADLAHELPIRPLP